MTNTPEPELTIEPAPTLNYYVEMQTGDGEAARIAREISIADYTVILLLAAMLISIWAMYLSEKLTAKGRKE